MNGVGWLEEVELAVVIDLLCGCNEEIAFHQDATSDWMSP
jgi:hypothetical protein